MSKNYCVNFQVSNLTSKQAYKLQNKGFKLRDQVANGARCTSFVGASRDSGHYITHK